MVKWRDGYIPFVKIGLGCNSRAKGTLFFKTTASKPTNQHPFLATRYLFYSNTFSFLFLFFFFFSFPLSLFLVHDPFHGCLLDYGIVCLGFDYFLNNQYCRMRCVNVFCFGLVIWICVYCVIFNPH